MATKLEQLKKLRAQLRKISDTLDYYKTLFEADGKIDDYEQGQLDKLNNAIKTIEANIDEKEEKLGFWDSTINFVSEKTEALGDWVSENDDEPDCSLVDKRPTNDAQLVSEEPQPKDEVPYPTYEEPQPKDEVPYPAYEEPQPKDEVPLPAYEEPQPTHEPIEIKVRPTKASVGAGKAKNNPEDVKIVQTLLVNLGYNLGTSGPNGDGVDGVCTSNTIKAIKEFQAANFSWNPDGKITAKGMTWGALSLGKVDDTHIISDDGLGVGDADIDTYKSQRDNETLYLAHSNGKRSGDVQCNVTSLAMMLISLNGGNEEEIIDIVKTAIEKKGKTYKSSWGLEELLAQYTEATNQTINSSSVMGKVATKLLKNKVASSENITISRPKQAIEECQTTILSFLKKGSEVIISGKFTDAGHIVSLRSVKSSGVVIQDPYGLCVVRTVYMANGQPFSQADFIKYETHIKRRLAISGRFEEIKAIVEAGGLLPQDLGKDNYYSWDDFGSMNIYRFVVVNKK